MRKLELTTEANPIRQAVIVYFDYGLESMDAIYDLGDELRNVINTHKLGEYDGHEIALNLSDGSLYMYGPSADILFIGIKSTLEKYDFLNEANVKLRYGPAEHGVAQTFVKMLNSKHSQ